MKVILYMGISANGYIARSDESTDWISDAEWQSYRDMCDEVGNVIMGRRTFEIGVEEGYFPFTQNSHQVVVTKKEIENKWPEQVSFVKTPEEALKILEEKGFESALVGGGGDLDRGFCEKGLVDEIYLDVEPIVFGKGIKVFADGNFEFKLELMETKQISKNEIQLHYKVLK